MAEPGSYEERHARAREVFGRFVPGVDALRAVRAAFAKIDARPAR
jgi:hypothetical protein